MANLVNLSQVKDHLGITSTDDDTRLASILAQVLSNITQLVGDLSFGEKTIQIANTNKYLADGIIGFNHINVTEILSIHDEDFESPAKVAGTDYMLRPDGTAVVLYLDQYITNDFGFFTVTYNAGWADGEVPEDFVGIVSDWVGLQYAADLGREVVEEQMGPRSVRYAGVMGAQKVDPFAKVKKRLRKYIPLHLRVW
jgi:hypothetical protein